LALLLYSTVIARVAATINIRIIIYGNSGIFGVAIGVGLGDGKGVGFRIYTGA
jgi:hypothetical protein